MKIKHILTASLTPYPGNARCRGDEVIEAVARSIAEFGWRQPIVVDRDLVVVVGHARLEAARRLGLERVPVHIAEDLSPVQLRAYRVADNALAERSRWDDELLVAELLGIRDGGLDPALSGLPPDDVERLLLGGGGYSAGGGPGRSAPAPGAAADQAGGLLHPRAASPRLWQRARGRRLEPCHG